MAVFGARLFFERHRLIESDKAIEQFNHFHHQRHNVLAQHFDLFQFPGQALFFLLLIGQQIAKVVVVGDQIAVAFQFTAVAGNQGQGFVVEAIDAALAALRLGLLACAFVNDVINGGLLSAAEHWPCASQPQQYGCWKVVYCHYC